MGLLIQVSIAVDARGERADFMEVAEEKAGVVSEHSRQAIWVPRPFQTHKISTIIRHFAFATKEGTLARIPLTECL